MQQTSIESYQYVKKNLGERQQAIYDGFTGNGSCTNLEISKLMSIPINSVTPRTNELVKMGLLVEDCKRECSVSGRKAISWKVRK